MNEEQNLAFQYCQKIVILSQDRESVLVCKRQGETDYNNIYTFAGGKLEVSDGGIIDGVKREKNEELGEDFKIKLLKTYTINTWYIKMDGMIMILPHYLAFHVSGEITLSPEYSNYKWVLLKDFAQFEPKVSNMSSVADQLQNLIPIATEKEYVTF